MEAEPHPQQRDRLRALYSYEVLDTAREKDFDDIAQLAARICGTPIAVVNLIDAERQWFKAETGLGVRETPLATSICSHVILEDDFVEIRDTLEDRRMVANPLCCGDPGLRFYAGALLKTDAGLPIGTLCVLDYDPRELTELQRDTIRILARQVMAQLEMRKALRASKVLRQEVDHRVKNSLQSLSAFVRIQGRYSETEEARSALSTVQNRIEAVATLHEQLYRADAGPLIDVSQYIGNLQSYFTGYAPPNVSVQVASDSAAISSQQAAALGTLINEFVANSIKHAFPDGRPGQISISLEREDDGDIRVVCADDGVGLPKGIGSKSGGLGMKVAEVLCAELGGDLTIDPSPTGLVISFRFTPQGVATV
ncbi:sensor histidine kinase [Microbaculum marinum]|uniref:Histidine kinase dimerization/phosphoacceptor domain -containing protein n=1 Tax=Microbaculum marinum TaxID=1764581 RepID=A0AAW9RM57_9HYPH